LPELAMIWQHQEKCKTTTTTTTTTTTNKQYMHTQNDE
jgi:hypothetical protein